MLAVAQAGPSPAPSATARPENPEASPPVAATPSAEVAARARLVFDQIRNDTLDRSQFTSGMDARLDAHGLSDLSGALRALGTVKSFDQNRRVSHGPASIYVFRIVCERAPILEEAIGFAADGKIDYLSFTPMATPPPK
jgi:hypothetical protein